MQKNYRTLTLTDLQENEEKQKKEDLKAKKTKLGHEYYEEFNNVKIKRVDVHDEGKSLLCFGYYYNSRDFSGTAKIVFVDTKKKGSLIDKMVMSERKTYSDSPLNIGKNVVISHSYKGKDKIYKEVYSGGDLIERVQNLMKFINGLDEQELSQKEKKMIEIAKLNMKIAFEREFMKHINHESFFGKMELKKICKDVDELNFDDFIEKYEKKYRNVMNQNSRKNHPAVFWRL